MPCLIRMKIISGFALAPPAPRFTTVTSQCAQASDSWKVLAAVNFEEYELNIQRIIRLRRDQMKSL